MTDLPLEQVLLLEWLAAPDAAGEGEVLARHAQALSAPLARDYMALAQGGPSYGAAGRPEERRFQRDLLRLAHAVAERVGEPAVAAEAARALAADRHDEPEAALAILARAEDDARRAGLMRDACLAATDAGALLLRQGRGGDAFEAYRRALNAAIAAGGMAEAGEGIVQALVDLANGRGTPERALGPLEAWAAHAQTTGDRAGLARARLLQGSQRIAMGQPAEARDGLQQALTLFAEMDDASGQLQAHMQLMMAYYALGDGEASARHLERATRLSGDASPFDPPEGLGNEGA